MKTGEIKGILEKIREKDYKEFSSKLLGGSSLPLLGVRLPELKKIATEITKSGEADIFLAECEFDSIEMCLIYSYVLGKKKDSIEKLLVLFMKAADRVDNWCTCDILCQSFKQTSKNRERVWELISEYLESNKTFYMRIAVVLMLTYYLDNEYIDRVFENLNRYKNEGYYYKMAVAWCIATAMAKLPRKTLIFMNENSLEKDTFNKAVNKMTYSYRISPEMKEILRKMRRK